MTKAKPFDVPKRVVWEAYQPVKANRGAAGVAALGRPRRNDYSYPVAEVEHISAVTFAVRDMARSVAFYRQLGFTMLRGGEDASFSSFRFGEACVNLATVSTYKGQWWGRVIFRVTEVDAYHQTLTAAGLQPDKPMDAPWGERFFHISDPDGHEFSFAALLLSRF